MYTYPFSLYPFIDYDMEEMSVNSKAHVVDETNLFTSELGAIQEQSSKLDVFNIEGAGAGLDIVVSTSNTNNDAPMKTPKGSGTNTPKDQNNFRQRAHSSPDRSHNRSSNSVASPRTNGSYRVGNKGQSPTQHSNPHALHSIRYNIAHKLSEGQDFTSSGAKILVVGTYVLICCVVVIREFCIVVLSYRELNNINICSFSPHFLLSFVHINIVT